MDEDIWVGWHCQRCGEAFDDKSEIAALCALGPTEEGAKDSEWPEKWPCNVSECELRENPDTGEAEPV